MWFGQLGVAGMRHAAFQEPEEFQFEEPPDHSDALRQDLARIATVAQGEATRRNHCGRRATLLWCYGHTSFILSHFTSCPLSASPFAAMP
jgi:hypothetical protein